MDAEEFYRQHLTVIGQIALSVCRRNGVDDHDAEDFASDIRLKLCDDDYAVIRKFQGKSSFTTYLTVVINKAFLDHRRQIWGKWTPSSQAKKFGVVGILLEQLVYGTAAPSTPRAESSSRSTAWQPTRASFGRCSRNFPGGRRAA